MYRVLLARTKFAIHIGVNLILDTSLRFQLIITKPLKNYLRLFSIVILGVESDSEVKLIL